MLTVCRSALLVTALAVLAPPIATPASGQARASTARQTCKRVEVKPPKRRKAEEIAEDSMRAALRDSLRQDLHTLAKGAGVERPQGIVVFRSETRGSDVSVRFHRTNLPNSIGPQVAERAQALLPRWPGKDPLHFVARLDSLPVPDAPIGSVREHCFPKYTNESVIQQQLQAFLAANPDLARPGMRSKQTRLSFVVTREGEVIDIAVLKSSGIPQLDVYAQLMAETLTFLPARIDGVPVDVSVTLPVSVSGPPRD